MPREMIFPPGYHFLLPWNAWHSKKIPEIPLAPSKGLFYVLDVLSSVYIPTLHAVSCRFSQKPWTHKWAAYIDITVTVPLIPKSHTKPLLQNKASDKSSIDQAIHEDSFKWTDKHKQILKSTTRDTTQRELVNS